MTYLDSKPRSYLERQWIQLVALVIATPALWLISRVCPSYHRGAVWAIGTFTWFWIAVAVPIAHQLWVALFWRAELHGGLASQTFGRASFPLYAAGFAILITGRLVTVTIFAVASSGTLAGPPLLHRTIAAVFAIPVLYLSYSVVRHFGIVRALGADHFFPAYRESPLVSKGIFRFTANGMYTFGMLVLYLPGLWFASGPALVVAAFQHLFIWAHYFATERPDMRRIYG